LGDRKDIWRVKACVVGHHPTCSTNSVKALKAIMDKEYQGGLTNLGR